MPFLQKCAKKFVHFCCRAPRGARGLKSLFLLTKLACCTSRPSRGAWIEINMGIGYELEPESRPSRGAWIEIFQVILCEPSKQSRPSRGAWIEMPLDSWSLLTTEVAPLAGRVD